MRHALDKAIMWSLVAGVIVLCVVQVLFAMPDEIRWQRSVRRDKEVRR